MSTIAMIDQIDALNLEYSSQSPSEILEKAFDQHTNIAISFSGAEDVVLIDMAYRLKKPFRVFSLDTGRLHPETYAFLEEVRKFYQISIEFCFPDAQDVQQLTTEKGLYSFFADGHQECCGIRKVKPLQKKLNTLDAWITGQRKDQSPTRQNVPTVQIDENFGQPDRSLIKYNPLANWTSEDVWNYIRLMEIPYNSLHKKGFISIGCEPCTRPVLPQQHEREGRWWWEAATQKECGLHIGKNSH